MAIGQAEGVEAVLVLHFLCCGVFQVHRMSARPSEIPLANVSTEPYSSIMNGFVLSVHIKNIKIGLK